jgi:hypothetical protein
VRIKRWAFPVLVVALGIGGFLASGAAARPTRIGKPAPAPLKMLPKVGCEGLLTIADFPGTVAETSLVGGLFGPIEEGKTGGGAFLTTCQYTSAPATEADPEPTEHIGIDVLGVEPRVVFEPGGRRQDLLLLFPKLPDTSRFPLHGIGTRAYYEIDEEGNAIGFLQVRNDIFYVAKEEAAGIRSMLGTVASELCKSCNEAEVPPTGKHK